MKENLFNIICKFVYIICFIICTGTLYNICQTQKQINETHTKIIKYQYRYMIALNDSIQELKK